ncbi:MAG: 8-oxoguanine deaminase [Planctomycetes bacterium]|nr:8-oxoguanine deaminase [Planctomycetota bacterium]
MTTLIHNTTIITCVDGEPQVLSEHDILIVGHVISAVQPTGAIEAGQADEQIEGDRYLVIPGLVNTHHHLYQTLTRGLKAVQDAPLFTWLTELYKRWQHVDYHAVKTAAKVSIAELLLSGCTTTNDHFYLFPQGSDVRLEAVLEAAEELGIRIHACRGSMTLGQSMGGLPPDNCTERDDSVLEDCRRAVEQFHDPGEHSMRRIDLAPCSPFNVSTELFRDTRELARSLGVLLHTHAAETKDEEKYCLERFGVRPIAYLHEHGWLGPDVYLAHCVHLNDDEIKLIAQTQTGVSYCPCSNMRLASGIPPIQKLIEQGAKVGIGVDGSSSNDGGNVLAEARQALLLQRLNGSAQQFKVADAFKLATIGGAACLNRPTLGHIAPGASADLALYRRDDIAFAGAVEQDPLAALILCHAPRADKVFVNGKVVVSDGRLVHVDETELAGELNQIVAKSFRS